MLRTGPEHSSVFITNSVPSGLLEGFVST